MRIESFQDLFEGMAVLYTHTDQRQILAASLDLTNRALLEHTIIDDRLVCAYVLADRQIKNEVSLQFVSSPYSIINEIRITIPGRKGLIGAAIRKGQPRYTSKIHKDPEVGAIIPLHNCRVALCIPLPCDDLETCAAFLFAHPEMDFFTPERLDWLTLASKQVVGPLKNAQHIRDLEREKERTTQVHEELRKKVAHELHDGPTQSVAAIAMRVNFARRLIERDPASAARELQETEELSRRTTREIRHILFTLRPLILESQGLIAALNSMAEKVKDTYNQDLIIQADPRLDHLLEREKQSILFYIAEEAVSNARKHAHAQHIWIRLTKGQNDLALLEIEDDGIGFDPDTVDQAIETWRSLGIAGMHERAGLVNGQFSIHTQANRGTTVQVKIPLTRAAADILRGRKQSTRER